MEKKRIDTVRLARFILATPLVVLSMDCIRSLGPGVYDGGVARLLMGFGALLVGIGIAVPAFGKDK